MASENVKPGSLIDVFRDHSDVLAAKAKAARAVPHAVSKGTERELILKEFLVPLLPQRLAIATGQIHASSGATHSKQEDLIIYDALNCPRLFVGGGSQLIPVESVAAVIEVKSRLTRKDIQEASVNIARAKGLEKRGSAVQLSSSGLFERPPSPILGVLFSYTLGSSEQVFRRNWLEAQATLPSNQRINLVCIRNEFTVTFIDRTFPLWSSTSPNLLGKLFAARLGSDSLLHFVLALSTAIADSAFSIPNLFQHVFSGGQFLEFESVFPDQPTTSTEAGES